MSWAPPAAIRSGTTPLPTCSIWASTPPRAVPGPGGPPGRGPGHRPGFPGGDYLRPARGGGGHPGPPRLPLYNEELAKRLAYDPSILTDLDLKGRSLTLLVNIENTAKARPPMRSPGSSRRPGSGSRWSAPLGGIHHRPGRPGLRPVSGEVYLTPDFDLSALIAPGGALNYGGWEDSVISGLLSAFRTAEGSFGSPPPPLCTAISASRRPSRPSASKRLGPHPVRAAGPAESDPVQRLL